MKKTLAILTVFVMLLCFSSCSENTRPDLTTLSERISAINESYAFDYFDAFIYENAYHIFFSLCSEDDILMSAEIDDNGYIDSLTIIARAEKMQTQEAKNAYTDFTTTVIDCFAELNKKETAEKNEKLSFSKPERYFSDLYETYSSLRYHFTFSSNTEYISLRCEYYEIIDTTDVIQQQ